MTDQEFNKIRSEIAKHEREVSFPASTAQRNDTGQHAESGGSRH